MEDGEAKLTVFGKPNFGDPTLFEKKHEVLGYYVQKWKTGDYGMFQPEYAVLLLICMFFASCMLN